MTLLDYFDASLFERPDALAVNDVTYAALQTGALRVAAQLRERGLQAGDRIALYCDTRLAFVYAFLAPLRLGAIVVPVNVLYRAAELGHVLGDTDARLVMTSGATREHIEALGGDHHRARRAVEARARLSRTATSPRSQCKSSWRGVGPRATRCTSRSHSSTSTG